MPADAAVEAKFYERTDGGLARCYLCHRRCAVAPGHVGACRVRKNVAGRLVLPYYGMSSGMSVDPIEKKPLYHFLPGSSTFSVGYVGCNLRCPFCQNYRISQSVDAVVERMTPRTLVERARLSGCPSMAHTYSEPLVHAEFIAECMAIARDDGLLNVLVTNGCALTEAASSVLSLCDAVNVDIKAWDQPFYEGELGGDLPTVRAFVELAVRLGVHVELTTLVIPGKNDDEVQIDGIAAFAESLSPDMPLHLSAYRPMYKYSIEPTPDRTIPRLAGVARRRLRYVYIGNVPGERASTSCASCGAVLVERRGYSISAAGLLGERCSSCGTKSTIINPLRKYSS